MSPGATSGIPRWKAYPLAILFAVTLLGSLFTLSEVISLNFYPIWEPGFVVQWGLLAGLTSITLNSRFRITGKPLKEASRIFVLSLAFASLVWIAVLLQLNRHWVSETMTRTTSVVGFKLSSTGRRAQARTHCLIEVPALRAPERKVVLEVDCGSWNTLRRKTASVTVHSRVGITGVEMAGLVSVAP